MRVLPKLKNALLYEHRSLETGEKRENFQKASIEPEATDRQGGLAMVAGSDAGRRETRAMTGVTGSAWSRWGGQAEFL